MITALAVHILAAVIWVGGLFFAYIILRPIAGGMKAPARSRLWRAVFERFFFFVWIAAVVSLSSGYLMAIVFLGGMGTVGLHINLMNASGMVMVLLFMYLYFSPWRQFQDAVDSENFELADTVLGRIRHIVHINLFLGLVTTLIGATGRYWG